MEILKIIETLQSYSEDNVAYKLDGAFANAVSEAVSLLIGQGERIADLENELRDERHRHDRYVDFELAEAEELRKLKEQHRWIPVTERLPQDDMPVGTLCEIVRVKLINGSITIGYCNRGMKLWFYLPLQETKFVGHGYDLTPVVAWMPLPEPPKEG